jgi:hypothetical protein
VLRGGDLLQTRRALASYPILCFGTNGSFIPLFCAGEVHQEDKELEIAKLSDADAVVAISNTEYAEIRELNPWVNLRLPQVCPASNQGSSYRMDTRYVPTKFGLDRSLVSARGPSAFLRPTDT